MFHLRSKDLLDVCKKPPTPGATATTLNKYIKASHEAINIIMSQLGHVVFLEPYLILTKLQDFVKNLCILPEKNNSTSSALATSANPYKITHSCANSKHNPNCTSHSKEQCFAEKPNLRLERISNQRRYPSNIPPSAQESALITGNSDTFSVIKLIIDCGATHHMFN
ncbi:hypothetical protein O181_084159 [Austropuccinia psidii MF-1]|uniref:Uncharacterized protein n=1 Tax=Austropuccinia psidii MF-1 TaxID=1389203 RepID=A0A9Q3FSY1_9BASI|nr:hypothetical protein [Austropuccinia psidii MF-1]